MGLFEKFAKGIETHTYQRIEPNYKVNIFLGYNDDGKMSMIITENGKEEKVKSSKLIDVNLKRREDDKLALSFDLLDAAYTSMFVVFCKDLILSCEQAGKVMAISCAIDRWNYWREMFGSRRPNILEKQEIKGLMGELFGLKEYLIPKYGYECAIKGWMGPSLGRKDFEIEDTWYEIKTINDGAVQVSISSIEQLESDIEGHLFIVKIDETSEKNEKAYNLNSLILQIIECVESQPVLEEFRSKLEELGYFVDPEYDKYNFVFKGSEVYRVNDQFPSLKRKNVSHAIGNVKYTIMIAGIQDFKEISENDH